MRQYRACADKGELADLIAADDRGIRADGRSFPDKGRAELVFSGDGAAGVDDIGEYGGRTKEDFVLADQPGVKADIVLYFHSPAQDHSVANHDVLPDGAIRADHRAGHDMGKMPDLCAVADGGSRVDHCRRMGKVIHK